MVLTLRHIEDKKIKSCSWSCLENVLFMSCGKKRISRCADVREVMSGLGLELRSGLRSELGSQLVVVVGLGIGLGDG